MPEKKEEPKEVKEISAFQKELQYMLRAGFATIWIQTFEEERAMRVIREACRAVKCTLYSWNILGQITLYDDEGVKKECSDPNQLFVTFAGASFKDKSVLGVMDYNWVIENPAIIRNIKEQIPVFKRDGKIALFIGPRLPLPDEISKEITIINFPLPTREELDTILTFVINSALDNSKTSFEIPKDMKEKLVEAALGLTSQEAEDAFSLALAKKKGDAVRTVLDQKCQILKKEGVLEYFQPEEKMDDIGGLALLKSWLVKRKRAFSPEARAFGLPNPKGMLIVGISGCGKSLTAKACASNWEVPLLRFDIGRVFQSLMGKSEESVRRAIQVAETLAPCILWIDEVEKGLSGVKASGELDSGVTARVVGTLLTWMQEKTSPVFLATTANDVSKLPPELLRKGRFDEIFFVDLPDSVEREEIVKIQLRKRNRTLPDGVIKAIAQEAEVKADDGEILPYTGAEIEQAVVSALYECFEDGKRNMTGDDVKKALKGFVPLATTMKEQIRALKAWGKERARSASGKTVMTSALPPGLRPVAKRKVEADESQSEK